MNPEPLASPPGVPLAPLTWDDTAAQLAASENYLLSTAAADGRPHVVPVLGLWLDDVLYFNTARSARKARTLAANPRIAATVAGTRADLVVEGTAEVVRQAETLERVAAAFPGKYPWWHPFVSGGEFYDPADTAMSEPRLVFAIAPEVVYAFAKEKGFSATRWRP